MSAHRLIRYPFGGTSIVRFDAYGRSVLRHRRPLNFSACGYSAPPRTRKWELLFLCSFAQGDWGGVVCNQEIARVVGSLSALQAGKAKEALRQPFELFLLPARAPRRKNNDAKIFAFGSRHHCRNNHRRRNGGTRVRRQRQHRQNINTQGRLYYRRMIKLTDAVPTQ
jgi:hypothetical protein